MTLSFLPARPDKSRSIGAILLFVSSLLGCAGEASVAPEVDAVEPDAPLDQEATTTASVRDASAPPSVADASARDAAVARDAGSDAGASDAGSSAADAGDPELEALRQLCVDEINRYRATVGAAPLARASDREACSDRGAQLDGDTGRAHGSAGAGGRQGSNGYCPAGAQNTCPGWPVGGRSGNATVADALKGCLKMMWAEGKPPTANCSGTCFMQHGHYLNMSAPATKRVACGFYRMKNGSYWLNQNFW